MEQKFSTKPPNCLSSSRKSVLSIFFFKRSEINKAHLNAEYVTFVQADFRSNYFNYKWMHIFAFHFRLIVSLVFCCRLTKFNWRHLYCYFACLLLVLVLWNFFYFQFNTENLDTIENLKTQLQTFNSYEIVWFVALFQLMFNIYFKKSVIHLLFPVIYHNEKDQIIRYI